MAIQRLREQARAGCFTNAPRAREEIRVMEPLMLDGIAESASDWFLACNFVKGLGTPLPSDYLIGHGYFLSFEPGMVLGTSSVVSKG